ncbi:hypothetical protein MMC17_009147 [Xylographa soralifera]|nr:hypothetical protein [Xylographa soralifera]
MSYEPTEAQCLPSLWHDEKDKRLISGRVIPITASLDVSQRGLAAPNDPRRPPLPSSKPPDRQSSKPIELKNLLNPVQDNVHSNAGSMSGSPSVSEQTTILPDAAECHVPALLLSSPFPCGQMSQRTPYAQAQNFECLDGANPAPPRPASQHNSTSTQPFSFSQVSCTEPTTAQLTGETPLLLPDPFLSYSAATIMPQMTFDTNTFKVPTVSMAEQNQDQAMMLDPMQGPVPALLDMHTASRDAGEIRKRNTGASYRFRQRRKQRELEAWGKIAQLEVQMREVIEEKYFYLRERNFCLDIAIRHGIPIGPRPPSPRHRFARLAGASRAGNQGVEGSASVPSQGQHSQIAEPPLPVPSFEYATAMGLPFIGDCKR